MVLVTGAAIVLGAAIIGLALPRDDTGGDALQQPPLAYPAAVIDGDALGAEDAPVVMEVYSDFQCPACQLFVTEQLHRLVGEFVTPGTLRIQARDIAILGRGGRDESLELAVGARCAAEQGRYWEFHDLVFWNQGRENRGDHSAAFVERLAAAALVDVEAFRGCVAGPDARAAIASQTGAAIGAGVQSTPTLIINGQSVVGVPQYDQLAAFIRSLVAAASPSPAP
jgi:protein-disulfide isomerase